MSEETNNGQKGKGWYQITYLSDKKFDEKKCYIKEAHEIDLSFQKQHKFRQNNVQFNGCVLFWSTLSRAFYLVQFSVIPIKDRKPTFQLQIAIR